MPIFNMVYKSGWWWGGGWTPWANTLVYYNINDNDTTSTIYDLSWNSIDQTWSGTASYTTDANYGRVASFSGSNYTAAGSRVNFGNEVTFIALVKFGSSGGEAVVTQCQSSSARPMWIFNWQWDNVCVASFAGSGNQYWVKATYKISAWSWTMIAWTRASDGTCKIYINWALNNTATAGWNPKYTAWSNLRIWDWGDNSSTNRLKWQFKLFIWENRTRTGAEIAAIAQEYWFTVS